MMIKRILFIVIISIIINIQKINAIDTANVSDMEMVVQKGHSDDIYNHGVSLSPDGKYIVSASSDGSIKLWELDGKLIKTFVVGSARNITSVQDVSFTADSKYIVNYEFYDNKIQIWSIEKGLVKTIKSHSKISFIRLSPDGKYIVCPTWFDTIDVLDFEGKLINTFKETGKVSSLSFSPDGKQFVTGSRDGAIKIWDIDGKLIKSFNEKPFTTGNTGVTVQFNTDGKYICSIGLGGRIKLWNVNGELIKTFGNEDVYSLSFSPDGKYIATIDRSGRINIWDMDGIRVKSINTFGNNTRAVRVLYSIDGKYLVCTMFPSNRISLWNTSGEFIRSYGELFCQPESVVFSPDGKYVAATSGSVIKLWSIDGRLIRSLKGKSFKPGRLVFECLDFSPYSKYIAAGADDGAIRIWNKKGEVISILKNDGPIRSIAFSPDGKSIAASRYKMKSLDGTSLLSGITNIKLWSIDGKHIRDFEEYGGGRTISFSPDGKYIAGSGRDKTIKVWGINGKLIKNIAIEGSAYSLSFSPDGKYIITASEQGFLGFSSLKLWSIEGKLIRIYEDIEIKQDLRKLLGNKDNMEILDSCGATHQLITKVKFSPGGEYIASASFDKTVKLWSLEGKLVKSFKGHSYVIDALSYGPDNKHLVSSARDATIKIWNIETGGYASLVSPENNSEWIMYTDDGYFDASKNGGYLVAMVKGLTAFGVDQFAIKNNRPDIILKRLGLGNEAIINHYYQQYKKRLRKTGLTEEQLSSDYHVPLAEIIKSKQDGKFLNISFKLSDNKYNLKRYNIYINDVPIYGAYGKEISGNNVNKTEKVELISGKSKIEVTCINEAGAESFRSMVYSDYKAEVKGDLYYIGFGVSKYKNKDLNLKYAHKDVLDLGNVLSKMNSGFSNIYSKIYTNKEVTVKNIVDSKELLKNAKVDDTFVLFIAGHGVHDTDEEETYYFLTYDAKLKDLKKTAASFELIEGILQGINPRKKIFLIDACESGEIEEETQDQYYAMADSRGLKARATRRIKIEAGDIKPAPRTYLLEQDRFIYNDLMRRSGAIVFSSSRGGEFSYEKDDIENGLFTESIINSLTSKDSDKNNDGIISTDELREYVINAVSKTSNNLQHPTVDRDNIYQKFGFQLVK